MLRLISEMLLYVTLLLLLRLSISGELWSPTEIEIKDALKYQTPSEEWGYQARKERNIRLFCIGGSNTMMKNYREPLVKFFENIDQHNSWTGTLNYLGISGTSPHNFLGMKYSFEKLPLKQWPNIILLEFSVNSGGYDGDDRIHVYDSIIGNFKYKYIARNISIPDFMFFDMMDVREYLNVLNQHIDWSYQERLKHLHPTQFNKQESSQGCLDCPAMHAVADYYGYPIVGWRKLGYKAFIRYYLSTNETFNNVPWQYLHNGEHISAYGGKYINDILFIPFFNNVMKSRVEFIDSTTAIIPMFPPIVRPYISAHYSTWDEADETISLNEIIKHATEWKMMESHINHHGDFSLCSHNQSAILELILNVSEECFRIQNCKFYLGFVHSWNISHIGDVSCDIIGLQHETPQVITKDIVIKGNERSPGVVMKNTGMVETPVNVKETGQHLIRCHKLDHKLTCIEAVSVVGEVMV